MCVTKKNYKTQPSTRQFERKDLPNGGAPAYTPASTVTPATKSQEGATTKSKGGNTKSKKVSKEKSKGGKSEAEKKSEDQERVSELKKLADQATSMGRGPPVIPPIKRNAKRTIGSKEFKDPKDKEYITLEEAVPDFAAAKLKGYNDEAAEKEKLEKENQQREKEKTLRVEPTQPSSGGDENQQQQKNQKKNKKTSSSGEKESSGGAGGGGGASKE